MYLTRLLLDPRSAQVRRDLGSPYEMHRTLVRAFVAEDGQTPPRFLWRLEPQMLWGSPPVVLVQSGHRADWGVLQALRSYLKTEPETKQLDAVQLFPNGQRCRFRLLANPTVSRAGKRLGLVGDDAQLAWLGRQGQRCGFTLESAQVTASDVLHVRKARADKDPISLQRVCFEGVLRVADAVQLKDALVSGIGPGKAFGCGLLSLARV
ncbi:type I-E CRISPR-associated protein Cas6/Cse3/CasE [Lysobacteraceae bacterium NML120232]|nr:type I-E CRISPR-associated protein Cas6/Cse3/CasE [Xanthomonadaceae bacterium NML120232]PJK10983.1 type I-E CRISPR-associated protein Cas6/Cse3/CasE [Xanthomonadaceae bacterium NML08-0793]